MIVNHVSRHLLPLAMFASLTAACSGAPTDSPDESVGWTEGDLINGTVASRDQARSAMLLWPDGLPSWCTAVRVGPRHVLTAAHCVVADSGGNLTAGLMPNFAPNRSLRVTRAATATSGDAASFTSVVIARTTVHPAWSAACGLGGCPYATVLSTAVPDLAVIETQADLPSSIAMAFVDTGFLASGETVTMAGYGCESAVVTSPNPRQLKLGQGPRMTFSDIASTAGFAPVSTLVFDANYAVTAGPSFGTLTSLERPGVCPGDSGGPLYRGRPELDSDELVVGINSGRKPDQVVISSVNFHARVSSELGLLDPTGHWLKSLIPADRFR